MTIPINPDAEVQVREECSTCEGSGEQPWSHGRVCFRCGGSGKVTRWVPLRELLPPLSRAQDEAMEEGEESDEKERGIICCGDCGLPLVSAACVVLETPGQPLYCYRCWKRRKVAEKEGEADAAD